MIQQVIVYIIGTAVLLFIVRRVCCIFRPGKHNSPCCGCARGNACRRSSRQHTHIHKTERINNCAVRTRKNITSGKTVE